MWDWQDTKSHEMPDFGNVIAFIKQGTKFTMLSWRGMGEWCGLTWWDVLSQWIELNIQMDHKSWINIYRYVCTSRTFAFSQALAFPFRNGGHLGSTYWTGLPHWCFSVDTERCLPLTGQVLSVPRPPGISAGPGPWRQPILDTSKYPRVHNRSINPWTV